MHYFSSQLYGNNGSEFLIKRNGCFIGTTFIIIFLVILLCLLVRQEKISYAICVLCVILVYTYIVCMQYDSESVLVMTDIGINVKTTNTLRMVQADFFQLHQIKDVVIIEAITMHSVVCYLAIILNGNEDSDETVYPLFQNSKPKLEDLKTIYRGIQRLLSLSKSIKKTS